MQTGSQRLNVSTPKLLLALETSCDETAVAVLRDGKLLSSEVASQVAAHEKFGGVVPEVASRNHLLHAPRLLERALRDAKIDISQIDAFAATSGPGLASSLMIGASIAKGLAVGFGKPYLAINHLEGHLLSPFFGDSDIRRNVSLVVSGGHTMTVLVRGVGDYQIIGRTVDDAAGEAFDKIARLLGLGYPGGPEVEKRAVNGDSNRFDFPRSMPDSENFSFSGLKTAVRYLLPKLNGDYLPDVCASVQAAIVDVLVSKTIYAAQQHDVDLLTVSGGVSCNKQLRKQMTDVCKYYGFELKTTEPSLCTDNAAMIAFAATLKLETGISSQISEEIDPNLALAL
jgi:N6-L-threonylcarbamoyladenine synthase